MLTTNFGNHAQTINIDGGQNFAYGFVPDKPSLPIIQKCSTK